jgi:hypothetical protein
MDRILYDERTWRPIVHQVWLHAPDVNREEFVGPWPVGLDWRAGAPAWRSTLILSRMFYRMCDMLQPRFDEIFQLRADAVRAAGKDLPPEAADRVVAALLSLAGLSDDVTLNEAAGRLLKLAGSAEGGRNR